MGDRKSLLYNEKGSSVHICTSVQVQDVGRRHSRGEEEAANGSHPSSTRLPRRRSAKNCGWKTESKKKEQD
jgi:hypothetical protein